MKYGTPLNRENFHMPAGFDLVVDYGASNQVCKLHVPALMPTTEQVSNAAVMKQRMYDFLGERSEEHTSELQSPCNLVCRLLLEKKQIQHGVLDSLPAHLAAPARARVLDLSRYSALPGLIDSHSDLLHHESLSVNLTPQGTSAML